MTAFRPERAICELGPDFYDPVTAAAFPQVRLRFRNDRAAASVGLDLLSNAEWTAHFGRFVPLAGSLDPPLALRYHGHQFRTYNPDLGDGRGFLFAQCRESVRDGGRLMDLGTKGSGQTPWSRAGDGRLTLKGGVREVLATEMLEALGVVTSRSLSLIETGEALQRGDEPSPARSAVLVRLSHGHIRYGSFQRLAYLGEADNLAGLVAYALRHYVPGSDRDAPPDEAAVALLDHVVTTGSRLAAQLMAAGFVHGVLNTDNINVTGECFDYGPWRFAPAWDPDFTAAYFDHHGLYSFGRQAEALQWNAYQLAGAFRLLAPVEGLKPSLLAFSDRYHAALAAAMLARLGLDSRGAASDRALAETIEAALTRSGVQPDRFWFDWRGGVRRAPSPLDPAYAGDGFAGFTARIAAYARTPPAHPYWSDPAPTTMLIGEVEAIWQPIAEADDWTAFADKIAAVRRMGDAMAEAP